jgi:hypothetical protein
VGLEQACRRLTLTRSLNQRPLKSQLLKSMKLTELVLWIGICVGRWSASSCMKILQSLGGCVAVFSGLQQRTELISSVLNGQRSR